MSDEYDEKFFDIARMSKTPTMQRLSELGTVGTEGVWDNIGRTSAYIIDGSDNLANTHKQIIEFQHVPSEKSTAFKAFITAFNESYVSDWSEEPVYGRVDPIRMFKQTTRSITISFVVPAATEGEGFENLGRVQRLVSFLYPNYSNADNALTISQSPLIRLKVMNLVKQNLPQEQSFGGTYANHRDEDGLAGLGKGLLGAVTNVAIQHNIDNPDIGVFATAPGTIIPKAIEVTVDFKVIHEVHLGWDDEGDFSAENFPYGADIKGSKPLNYADTNAAYRNAAQTYSADLARLREEERANQQLQAAKDIAKSHFLNANGDLNMWGKHVQRRLGETKNAAAGDGSALRFGIKDRNKAAYYAGAMAVIGEDGRLNENATADDVASARAEASEAAGTLSEKSVSWIR